MVIALNCPLVGNWNRAEGWETKGIAILDGNIPLPSKPCHQPSFGAYSSSAYQHISASYLPTITNTTQLTQRARNLLSWGTARWPNSIKPKSACCHPHYPPYRLCNRRNKEVCSHSSLWLTMVSRSLFVSSIPTAVHYQKPAITMASAAWGSRTVIYI